MLLRSKLVAPAPRAGHIARAGVGSLLQAGLGAKLCLVAAPAGSGKTTLLAHWRTTAGAGRVAWVSLDEEDNDPTRLWVYFAGAGYYAGWAYRRQQVQVALVGDTVQLAVAGRVIKVHPIRHDRAKEHGAFATPNGRPRRQRPSVA